MAETFVTDHRALLEKEAAQLVLCLDNLKCKRDALTEEIVDEEAEKVRLSGELRTVADRLCRIHDNLLQKRAMNDEYNRAILEGETTYNKLVDTSRALVRGVQDELGALKAKEERFQAAVKNN